VTDVRTGERLPAFTVRLDKPPVAESNVAEALAARSAERYGRSIVEVELDLEAAAQRISGSSPGQAEGGANEDPGLRGRAAAARHLR
jgi:hypothetical protein